MNLEGNISYSYHLVGFQVFFNNLEVIEVIYGVYIASVRWWKRVQVSFKFLLMWLWSNIEGWGLRFQSHLRGLGRVINLACRAYLDCCNGGCYQN